MSLLGSLLALAGAYACLGGLGVVLGALAANVLDARDERRNSRPAPGRIGGREP